jgi:hypothetical protein
MNYNIDENRKKYKPEELTDDGIPTIETQLKELSERDKLDEIYKIDYVKNMKLKVKCIALHKMGKSILTNTLKMTYNDRKKLVELMHEYNGVDAAEITNEFNYIANEELFENNKDVSNYPVYKN